jgi:hypothetical protein
MSFAVPICVRGFVVILVVRTYLAIDYEGVRIKWPRLGEDVSSYARFAETPLKRLLGNILVLVSGRRAVRPGILQGPNFFLPEC